MKRIHKRMYAVSLEGVGLIAGTMAYSRRSAIEHFLCNSEDQDLQAWEKFKRAGYRTVMAQIKILRVPRYPQASVEPSE